MGAEKEVGLLRPSHPGQAALPRGPSHSAADFFQPMFMTDSQMIDRYWTQIWIQMRTYMGLPQWLSGKESARNAGAAGDVFLIPGSERSPGGGHGNPLQSSCLETHMDREARKAQSRT